MSESATANPRVGITQLGGFIMRALSSAGIPPDDARQVARLMVEADARGGDAHGIFRLPQYVKQLQNGGINARPNMRIVSDRAGTALIDGDNALGHLVMKRKPANAALVGWERGAAITLARRSFTHGCPRKRT
jgi:L-2-hydroxycarboxylate dehydrogenase (NAD+)